MAEKKRSTKKAAKKKATKKKVAKKKGAKQSTRKAATKKAATKKAATKKKAAAKKSAKKKSSKTRKTTRPSGAAVEKDPRGGLTAAGRKAFAKKDGSHLKPGVTRKLADMTPSEMRRKGSWAVRFYGRKKLPPLIDAAGRPTRHALSAHAWGEPVPKTVAAARRIATKGERLLARYRRIKSS